MFMFFFMFMFMFSYAYAYAYVYANVYVCVHGRAMVCAALLIHAAPYASARKESCGALLTHPIFVRRAARKESCEEKSLNDEEAETCNWAAVSVHSV